MNPRLTTRRPGRTLAVVGALVAVVAAATMALVAGSASAAPADAKPGTCTENVNVRAEPRLDSRIVAVCEAGDAVQVAETRNGFVRLTDLDGWAKDTYVRTAGSPARSTATPTTLAPTTMRPTTAAAPSDGRLGDGAAPTSKPRGDRERVDDVSALRPGGLLR